MLLQRHSYGLLHESVTQNSDNKEKSRRSIDPFFVTHLDNTVCNFLVRRMNQRYTLFAVANQPARFITTVSRKFIVVSMIRSKDRENFATYRSVKFSILRLTFRSALKISEWMSIVKHTQTHTTRKIKLFELIGLFTTVN